MSRGAVSSQEALKDRGVVGLSRAILAKQTAPWRCLLLPPSLQILDGPPRVFVR